VERRRRFRRSENYSEDDDDYHNEPMGPSYYYLDSSSHNVQAYHDLGRAYHDHYYLVASSYEQYDEIELVFFDYDYDFLDYYHVSLTTLFLSLV
jgi:hypothetical protein